MENRDLPLSFRLLLATYREYLTARGLRPQSIHAYTTKILPFLRFLPTLPVEEVEAVTLAHIRSFQIHLMAEGHRRPPSLRTVGLKLTLIKAFFRFLYKTGRVPVDVAAPLPLPKRPRGLPRGILSEAEALALLRRPDLATPLGIRDRALLELLYSAGLRNSEIRLLELKDLDLEARTLFVRGKGGKEALVPFGREAQKALLHYLHFARMKLLLGRAGAPALSPLRAEEEAGREFLFLSKRGHALTTQNLIDVVRRYVRDADLPRRLSPHSLRHTCATHLLKGGADIRHIQRLLRHDSLTSTEVYTHLVIEDLKEAQARFHPREHMDA